MAKINHEKQNNYDKIDHYEWAKRKNKIQDAKWKHHTLKPVKKLTNLTHIDLKQHEMHDWQPIKGPFGNHAGKIICNTCGGKWVTWLPKGAI
jgi:hypothetical protein